MFQIQINLIKLNNIFFSKLKQIRLNHNLKKDSILTELETEIINKKLIVPPEIRAKILYSSFLESSKIKLGYNKRIILESILEKQQIKKNLEKSRIRPFLATLQTIGYDINFPTQSESETVASTKTQPVSREFPKNWLEDYEYYEKNEKFPPSSFKYGTPDPNVPSSKTPCNGCGANLHCTEPTVQGYIPSEIFIGRTNNELKTIICQRCHFLDNYNIALDVTVSTEDYIKTISTIKDKYALAILIVDLLDFPCSMWQDIQSILGDKRPIFIVGNKVDLLPKDSPGYLNHIKNCLKDELIKSGLNKMNIKHTCLISAKTGYGIEELITQLHKIWGCKGDVYLMGCANVGKSSLFNILLKSDYCKVMARDLVKKATTCPWPGTTLQLLKFPILRPSDFRIYQRYTRLLSERAKKSAELKLKKDQLKMTRKIEDATLTGDIGLTFKNNLEVENFSMARGAQPIQVLNEKSKEYEKGKWCFDTPGVLSSEQIHNLLTEEELLLVNPQKMITPRKFKLEPNMTLFLAALGRIDFIGGDVENLNIIVYSSLKLPVLITKTADSKEIYENFLGSELFGVPFGDEDRINHWPELKSSNPIQLTNDNNEDGKIIYCDIVLSSAGWLGINLPIGKSCNLLVWTPEKRGIFVRRPALTPYAAKLCGKRIRKSLAYQIGKPFII